MSSRQILAQARLAAMHQSPEFDPHESKKYACHSPVKPHVAALMQAFLIHCHEDVMTINEQDSPRVIKLSSKSVKLEPGSTCL
jgi:hypothetical protein